jgi:3-deoxy-D-arabino-heptulosonate 7-phosphate (DAHP) synthase
VETRCQIEKWEAEYDYVFLEERKKHTKQEGYKYILFVYTCSWAEGCKQFNDNLKVFYDIWNERTWDRDAVGGKDR